MSHCNRDYRDLQNRQQNFPDFPISCSCRNIQFSFNSQSMYVYTWKTISALIHGILQRLIQKKIAIIPSTQSKRINRQNRKRTLLIEWRMHFRTFIFMEHIWNIKGKNKKPIWVTLPAENEGEKKRKKSSVWDWHFGVVWIRQLDLQWHGPICVYPRTPPLYPWWQGLSASMMVTVRPHTICTILHEQSVHKCNTVRRLNHIFPAN